MANHSVTEGTSWINTAPQVPDAGPASFMTTASATIEAFVTLLATRTRYLKATEEADVLALNNKFIQANKYIEANGVESASLTFTLATSFNQRCVAPGWQDDYWYVCGTNAGIVYFSTAQGYQGHQLGTVSNAYTGTIQDIYSGSGGTFFVGTLGEIQYLSGATSTFTRTLSLGGAGFRTCASNNTNVFLAAGDTGLFRRTTAINSTTWTTVTSPFGTGSINVIRYFSAIGLFIAGSDQGQIATSPDGITWTLRANVTGFAMPGNLFYSEAYQMYFMYFGTTFPGVYLAYSTNGISWTQTSLGFGKPLNPATAYFSLANYYGVVDFADVRPFFLLRGFINSGSPPISPGSNLTTTTVSSYSHVGRLPLLPTTITGVSVCKTPMQRLHMVFNDAANTLYVVSSKQLAVAPLT